MSWAEFKDFSLLLDNSANSLVTADENAAQWTAYEFGVAVDAEGKVSRVAKDNASSVATVSGKSHSDHGSANVKVVVPVEGCVKISVAQCTYSGGPCVVKDANGTTVLTIETPKDCWKNDHSKVSTGIYVGDATTLTISGMSYCAYVAVEKTEAPIEPEAPSFDKQAATISWAVGNESEGTLSEGIDDAVSLTKVTMGTDLTLTSSSTLYTLGKEGTVGPYCTYQPATSNPGSSTTDMIEYTIQVKKGLTFTPTSVSFDAVKEGTDNAYFSWSYTVDGAESDINAYSDATNQIRRNNDANPSAPLNHVEKITATGGQKVTLRIYISNVANNKKMSIGNVKINGTIDGTVASRAFTDFKLDFRTDPYTVVAPASGLPEGVEVNSTSHDGQHGYSGGTITVPVDGPVKFTIATCGWGGNMAVKDSEGNVLATLSNKGECDTSTSTSHFINWTYNSETPATLVFSMPSYFPFFYAEACELIPMRTVTYYDVDGKTILGSEEVEGGSALAYAYGEFDATVAEGLKFRGWFNSTQASAVKVAEGTSVQENLSLYAKATNIENPQLGDIFTYTLNSTSFYIEDHEAITSTGSFHDTQHGFGFGANQSISVKVAGNAILNLGTCQYGDPSTIVVTDAAGNQVGEAISIPCAMGSDGAVASVTYTGEATTLTATFTNGGYLHNVTVYNVADIPQKNEAGYYELAAGDGASLQLVLASLKEGDKIYLPNGTYDFGEKTLTTISANNVSIIGESMEGTIIRNCPPKENEGISKTATLLNTSTGLYLQDLTIQNALDYYATGSAGRAVCLQDKGAQTICKNVKMLSYQDTYYSNNKSQFYWEDSEIHGTVDYLCGDGDVVYNRVKFVNESRAKDSKSGSDVLCAPYTSKECKWGYVFLDCSVESKCKDFTFARSWGGESKAQFLNTTVLDGSLNASRFTANGMNVAAYCFKEYNTMDASGKVISPASNVINFTHSSGNKQYETILSADEAAKYTIANIYGEWAPDQIAKQVTNSTKGTVFLVDGVITTTCPESGTVRIANARGGFGPEVAVAKGTEKSYNVTATITVDGKTKVLEQTVETVEYDAINTVDIILPDAQVKNWKMGNTLVENVTYTETEGVKSFTIPAGTTIKFTSPDEENDVVATVDVEKSTITLDGEKLTATIYATSSKGDIKVVYQEIATAADAVAEAAEAVAPVKAVKNGKLVITKDGNSYNAAGAQIK